MAAAAAGLACKKNGGTPKVGFSKCIEDWPSAGGPHPVKPSLAVDAPKLLWTVDDLNGSQAMAGTVNSNDGGPVLSKDRLALQAGRFIYFLNKDGTNPQAVGLTSFSSYPSGLVADLDGNVYFVAQDGVFSADATGRKRWQGGDGAAPVGEFSYYPPPVLGPDGVVYAVTSNERVFALRTQDGSTIWSQPAPGDKFSASRVMGGGGMAVFVAIGDTRTDALNTKDGTTLGSFVDPVDGRSFVWEWGNWVEGWDFGITDGRLVAFDTCGNSRWLTRIPWGGGVVTSGEGLVTVDGEALILYGANGDVVAGPAPAEGRPLVAGADGTIYTVGCQASQQVGTPGNNRILAYSPDLTELWRFDLSDSCMGMTGNVVLDEDGVMYLMRRSPNGLGSGTQVMAIQTRSPGLADSSWPSWRHDNRGTAWLVPGTPTSTTNDADVSDAEDAPVEGGASD